MQRHKQLQCRFLCLFLSQRVTEVEQYHHQIADVYTQNAGKRERRDRDTGTVQGSPDDRYTAYSPLAPASSLPHFLQLALHKSARHTLVHITRRKEKERQSEERQPIESERKERGTRESQSQTFLFLFIFSLLSLALDCSCTVASTYSPEREGKGNKCREKKKKSTTKTRKEKAIRQKNKNKKKTQEKPPLCLSLCFSTHLSYFLFHTLAPLTRVLSFPIFLACFSSSRRFYSNLLGWNSGACAEGCWLGRNSGADSIRVGWNGGAEGDAILGEC